jgi:endo-1,4-beta-xylanase
MQTFFVVIALLLLLIDLLVGDVVVHKPVNTNTLRFAAQERGLYAWDVVNEAIDDNLTLRETFWLKALGPDYIQQAIVWAHEADPQAKLFYNDYNGEALGPKSDEIYNLVKNLKAPGVPIDGIGLQSHFIVEHPPDFGDIAVNLKRLAALGLEIHVTELDVSLPMPPTEEKITAASKYLSWLFECVLVYYKLQSIRNVGIHRQIFLDSKTRAGCRRRFAA